MQAYNCIMRNPNLSSRNCADELFSSHNVFWMSHRTAWWRWELFTKQAIKMVTLRHSKVQLAVWQTHRTPEGALRTQKPDLKSTFYTQHERKGRFHSLRCAKLLKSLKKWTGVEIHSEFLSLKFCINAAFCGRKELDYVLRLVLKTMNQNILTSD